MIDRENFTDHRMLSAQATGDRYAVERSWCVAPDEPKVPGFVWQVLAWGTVLTCLFVFTPVIVRALMS